MNKEEFWTRVNKQGSLILDTPCWEWTGWKRAEYGVFMDYKEDGKRTTKSAHRWLWEQENGRIPKGLHLCHECDNPCCVRPDHLFLGSRTDNMRDMLSKGRKPTILTNDQVVRARLRAGTGENVHDIAAEFNVNVHRLADAIRGKTFPHISEPRVQELNFGRLTKQQVEEIKEALKKPFWGQQTRLATKYGVTPSLISRLASLDK